MTQIDNVTSMAAKQEEEMRRLIGPMQEYLAAYCRKHNIAFLASFGRLTDTDANEQGWSVMSMGATNVQGEEPERFVIAKHLLSGRVEVVKSLKELQRVAKAAEGDAEGGDTSPPTRH